MTFQSLYRKHRPQRFEELLGQDHVTTALRNAVREDRVGHAYLFSGPRGTGKTTSARLLAKALNCTQRAADGEPCGTCDSCVEIARGGSMDVIELDAASNNGVAEMRSLLERVVFRSAGGHRRVYIVDEVHMLTTAASNALLKTLEEPPDHVIFVLATTEPEKVLPTIRSRTQHFEFRLLPTEEITAYLGLIAGEEGVEVDEDTLRLVARRGAGSVRDALSLLDQALALGDGALGADHVRSLFDATPFDQIAALVDAVAAEDVPSVVTSLDAVLEAGADPRRVADDLLRHLRNAYLVTASRGAVRLDVLSEERVRLEEQGRTLGAASVERAIVTLGEAAVDMRRAPDPRLVLEVALLRLARRQGGSSLEVLLDRVERLERAVEALREGAAAAPVGLPAPAAGDPVAPAAADGPGAEQPSPAAPDRAPDPGARPALGGVRARRGPKPEDAEPPATDAPPDPAPVEAPPAGAAGRGPLDLDDVILAWPSALESMRGVLKAVAREAQPVRVDDSTVVLGLPRAMSRHRERLDRDASTLAEVLTVALGSDPVTVRIEEHEGFLVDDGPGPTAKVEPDAAEPDEAVLADDPDDDAEPPADQPAVDSVEQLVEAFDATVEGPPGAEGSRGEGERR